jgi:hypothetical protein
MNTHWQLMGFYVSMPCSQKVCKNVQIQQHQHGASLALIPHMNFNMGALTWNPILVCNFSFRESKKKKHQLDKITSTWTPGLVRRLFWWDSRFQERHQAAKEPPNIKNAYLHATSTN